jgi:hypothetical protein
LPPAPQALVVVPGWQRPEESTQPLQVAAWQVPLLQVSPEGQAVQAPPPVPQAPVEVPATQVLPWQQPEQLLGPQVVPPVQTPLLQDWPAEQATQAAPPVPQAEVDVPVWQVPLASMQPLQVAVWQVPLTHD